MKIQKKICQNKKNDRKIYVYLQRNYFKQNSAVISNINKVISIGVINIYVVYKLDPKTSTRNADYTIQNPLFGAMKNTKNTDSSKNNYTGYGLCFDEGGEFGHTVKQGNFNRTTNAKHVIILCVDMSIHAINRSNNINVWVETLFKELMTQLYMQKNSFIIILQNLE